MKSTALLRLTTALLLSSSTLLTACGDKPRPETIIKTIVKKELTVAKPDDRLRKCEDRPVRRPMKNSNDTATLLNELFQYGDDCKSKLDATWLSIEDALKAAEKFNAQQKATDK